MNNCKFCEFGNGVMCCFESTLVNVLTDIRDYMETISEYFNELMNKQEEE